MEMMINDNEKLKGRPRRYRKISLIVAACVFAAGLLSFGELRNAASRRSLTPQDTTTQHAQAEIATLPQKATLTTEPVVLYPDTTEINTQAAVEEFSSLLDEIQQEAVGEAQAVFDNAAEPLSESALAEETTQTPVNAEPVSYALPAGTELGKDYSMGIPVFSQTMQDWRTHNGVDFIGAEGDTVSAIADGTVTAVRADTVWGGVVETECGGGITVKYCGLANDTIGVAVGDVLVAGDSLGGIGVVPVEASDGFHLHLEIRRDGVPVDPLEIMGRG